ncbi:uncharacterized protein LOC131317862 isoform X1 [Rhododendron vialii]|uniref:uncharacterized protein LOC131317862 isoform X1 n=1 Tax=Rhododendron vialii TaxID=182163 RepID=UPI00265F6158|nr:uncharacterized protein LOC131317862 isoform X1 [Rhododendron vialii]
MITTEEPIMSRLHRLDKILNHLEERRGSRTRSPRSSYASTTTSSGTLTSGGDGRVSSTADLSPESIEDHCLPVDVVVVEAEMKGTLLERLVLLENRVLKLCVQFEEELESEKALPAAQVKKKKKGLKQLVKSCAKGSKTKEI